DFRNTVVIITSNLGSETITGGAPMGFTADGQMDPDTERRVMRRLREEFRPEFINRIDEVIVFTQLGEEELGQITRLMLQKTEERLQQQGIAVRFTDEAVGWLSERGYQPSYGARPLARTIQRNVGNKLSRMVLDGQVVSGDNVVVDVDDQDELLRISAMVEMRSSSWTSTTRTNYASPPWRISDHVMHRGTRRARRVPRFVRSPSGSGRFWFGLGRG